MPSPFNLHWIKSHEDIFGGGRATIRCVVIKAGAEFLFAHMMINNTVGNLINLSRHFHERSNVFSMHVLNFIQRHVTQHFCSFIVNSIHPEKFRTFINGNWHEEE